MISRHDNCLFVHIPKVAGQSVEHFFLERADLSWENRESFLCKYNPDPTLGPERLAHLTASEYLTHGYLKKAEFDTLFKFAFVRNPWDRLVSEYRYGRYTLRYSFKDFVQKALPEPDAYADAYRHVMPQYRFIYDNDGDLLVDFVGRFEQLHRDFNSVCEQLGISDAILPHVNASTGGGSLKRRLRKALAGLREPFRDHYTDYYDDETRRRVANLYATDLDLFGYSFGD